MSNNLDQLRICVEKPLDTEKHTLHHIRKQASSEDHYHRLRAAFFTKKLWPKGSTISISFDSTTQSASWTPIDVMEARREPDGSSAKLDPIEYKIRKLSLIEGVKTVVKERIQPICGLNLTFVESDGHVRIGFDEDKGSWSLVGTDCLQSKNNTMNFAWLDAATIMHEFGHLLGMIHEHQNPRGNTIDWNVQAVDEWAKQTQGWDKETTYKNIIQKYNISQINGSSYDPKSIMLYYFPAKLTLNHHGTQMNLRLSQTDIEYISKMYPGGTVSSHSFYVGLYGGRTKIWLYLLIIAVVIIIIGISLYFILIKR